MADVDSASYFSRMIPVPEIGKAGFHKLQSANVAVVGVGGVGSSISYYLAQSGIGHLKLIDQDIVEQSNLHRLQGLGKSHLYYPKAEAMGDSLERLVPSCRVEALVDTLTVSSAAELLKGSDVVVDGLDNFRTRFILNRHSVNTRTPYVFTSAIQTQGHVGVFSPPETACLECRFHGVIDGAQDGCDVLGVTPIITGLVGAIAANETLKVILSSRENQRSRLQTIDTVSPEFIQTDIAKRSDCGACGPEGPLENEPKTETIVTLCGGKTFNIVPRERSDIDLSEASRSIPRGSILTSTESVLVYRIAHVTVSVFRNGRVLVGGVESPREALRIAEGAIGLVRGISPVSS